MARSKRPRNSLLILTGFMFLMGTVAAPPIIEACTKGGIAFKIRKALANGDIAKACRYIKRFKKKFPKCPLPPLIGMPSAGDCSSNGVPLDPDPAGRGRGGGFIGAGPPGACVGGRTFIFNGGNPTNCFTYSIVADGANPAGFTIVSPTGMAVVPINTTAVIPFDIDVSALVAPGTCAFFDVIVTDCGNAKTVPGDYQRFKLTVTTDCEIRISSTSFEVVDGMPFTARWTIKNLSAAPVVKPYTFLVTDDPASIAETSAGGTIAIPDGFSMPRSAAGGGSVSLDAAGGANDEKEIPWDMAPGEYCDPAMISCCGIDFGGGVVSDQCFVNVADVITRPCCTATRILVQGVSQGGALDLDIGGQFLAIPTAPGLDALQVADAVAQQVHNHAEATDGFDFTVAPIFEELGFHHTGGALVTLLSNDPGLFTVHLPQTPIDDLFDTVVLNPSTLDMSLPGHGFHAILELIAMTLTSASPISVINAVPTSPPDLSSIQMFQGDNVPVMNPGDFYGAKVDWTVNSLLGPVVIPGPITVDTSPLALGEQAFNLIVPLELGPGPDVQMEIFIHVRPFGFDGAGQTPVQINQPSIVVNQLGNQFQLQYQAQTPIQVVGIQHETITMASALVVPQICHTQLGDVNDDNEVSGLDIQEMADAVINGVSAQVEPCADMDGNGLIESADVAGFVSKLVTP